MRSSSAFTHPRLININVYGWSSVWLQGKEVALDTLDGADLGVIYSRAVFSGYWWPCPVTPSLLRLSPSLLMIAQLEALNANLQVSWKWKSAKRWGQRLRNPGLDLGRVFISRRKASGRAGQSHLARMSQPPPIPPHLPKQHPSPSSDSSPQTLRKGTWSVYKLMN